VGSAGCILIRGGSTNIIDSNGDTVFLLETVAEQQECGNGGAMVKVGWY